MNTYHLIIASADGTAFDGEAVMLSLRGADGDLAILAGHEPFITSVKSGACRVQVSETEVREGTVESGLLTVSEEKVMLLSSSFQWN